MNEEAKARMAAFDDGQDAAKHDDLQNLCAQFLNTVLPGRMSSVRLKPNTSYHSSTKRNSPS